METEQVESRPPELYIFTGEWNDYQVGLFEIYKKTILNNKLMFRGDNVSARRHPESNGFPAAFLHLISEGSIEDERTPDLLRCERLGWIEWVIRNAELHPEIYIQDSIRGRERNVLLWYDVESYAVILGCRNGFYLLKSAYVFHKNRADDIRRDIGIM